MAVIGNTKRLFMAWSSFIQKRSDTGYGKQEHVRESLSDLTISLKTLIVPDAVHSGGKRNLPVGQSRHSTVLFLR